MRRREIRHCCELARFLVGGTDSVVSEFFLTALFLDRHEEVNGVLFLSRTQQVALQIMCLLKENILI